MALAGSQVEGRVARGGGGVGRRPPLEQLLDDVGLPQTAGDVQGRLVVLDNHGDERPGGRGLSLRDVS